MCKIDPNYSQCASLIYQMYRNGPVHEFAPKVLENKKGQPLKWLCYAGGRCDYNFEVPEIKLVVTHLKPVENPANNKVFYLPISTICLVMDLLGSIDEFQKMGPADERLTAWNRAARELINPRPSDFTVP
jgi:hypothetical protein